jgi:hypothetical protein
MRRQMETSNKTLVGLIKRKIEEKPRRWHEVLTEALWAYSTAKPSVIKVTPFEFVYGQETMIPIEINLRTPRVMYQDVMSLWNISP